MSHFYGIVKGHRGAASRCGSKNKGLYTIAAGWQGAIETTLWHEDGQDYYRITLTPWGSSGGGSRILALGTLDSDLRALGLRSYMNELTILAERLKVYQTIKHL
jgi:hypothetical protein